MTSIHDPIHSSIDSIIRWLREQRKLQPHSPLSQLLDLSGLPLDRVTDIACIDLIERKRLGQTIRVEDLLREIPQLAQSETALLDLIDAEICVLTELGQEIHFQEYTNRFPNHAYEIAELARLSTNEPIISGSVSIPLLLSSEPGEQKVSEAPLVSLSSCKNELELAIHPPAWFTREQLHSRTERSCLLRGRDTNEHRSVALKIIRLQDDSKQTALSALAEVEAAAAVRHPAWIQPEIAVVESQCLAVIRPWVFGTRWDIARQHASIDTRLRDLARVGYALQSAHDTKTRHGYATHGGLHGNNLIVDAEGQLRIVDAGAYVQPAADEHCADKADPTASSDGASACSTRRRRDGGSLGELIRRTVFAEQGNDHDFRRRAAQLDRLCQSLLADDFSIDACARIADATLKLADGKPIETATISLASKTKTLWNRLRHR